MYISINADGVGSKFGDLASQDNEQGLSDLSSSLKEAHAMIDSWVQQQGGKVISSSGDENLFMLQDVSGLEQLLSQYTEHTGNTITVGMGETISQAIKAMIYGKSIGPGTTNTYSPEMEQSLGGGEQEPQQDDSQEAQPNQELPNDSATPPEQDPTKQLPAGDEANSDFEGNNVVENGGPKVGGPVDQENGVDTVAPIPSQNLEEQAAGQTPAPVSPVQPTKTAFPQGNSVQSQQAAPQQPAQNKAQPIGNAVAPQSTIPQENAVPNKAPELANGKKSIEMPVDSLVNEHEKLVGALESPDKTDDQSEIKEQGEELQDYQAVQNGDKSPEEVEQQEAQEPAQEENAGELTGVMDAQINSDEAPEESEQESDGVGQVPENSENVQENSDVQDNVNGQEEVSTESEDGVDVETLRDEIAQNLLTFKENKQFFEDSKKTNPKLYLATISLLRNMINMAKQLGLTPGEDMAAMVGESQDSNAQIAPENKDFAPNDPKEEGDKKPFPPKKDGEDKKEEKPKEDKKEDKKTDFGKK